MSFAIFNTLRHVATVGTATLATVILVGSDPAMAALFKISFCGPFDDGGQVLPSSITVDTSKKDSAEDNFGLVDAEITTKRQGIDVTYDESLLTESGKGGGIPGFDTFSEESVYWRFVDATLNNFNAVIPLSIFDDLANNSRFSLSDNSEIRPSIGIIIVSKDKDDNAGSERVPEPLTIIGVGTALAALPVFKKEYQKKKEKAAKA